MIPDKHSNIWVGGVLNDMSHLAGFVAIFARKGRQAGSDLPVHIRISNHVISRRAMHLEIPDMRDQNGIGRKFDMACYAMSLELPATLKAMLTQDQLCYVSRSYGGAYNLVNLRMQDGKEWAIVFRFRPMIGMDAVALDVLSAYEKVVDQRKIHRKNISYFARQCLFKGIQIP